MPQSKTHKPLIEANGHILTSFLSNLGMFQEMGTAMMEKHGINHVHPEKWYPYEACLALYQEISKRIGDSALYKIGLKVMEKAPLTPGVNSIEQIVSLIDAGYHKNHRLDGELMFDIKTGKMKEGIGHYRYEKVKKNMIKLVSDTPYPCDFDRGMIEFMVTKVDPNNKNAHVVHDRTQPCRKKGEASCTYIILW